MGLPRLRERRYLSAAERERRYGAGEWITEIASSLRSAQ
jgi:hypothetical protein